MPDPDRLGHEQCFCMPADRRSTSTGPDVGEHVAGVNVMDANLYLRAIGSVFARSGENVGGEIRSLESRWRQRIDLILRRLQPSRVQRLSYGLFHGWDILIS